jgi:hypothetical protein
MFALLLREREDKIEESHRRSKIEPYSFIIKSAPGGNRTRDKVDALLYFVSQYYKSLSFRYSIIIFIIAHFFDLYLHCGLYSIKVVNCPHKA